MALSATKPCSVSRSAFCTTLALTRALARSLIPATVVLPPEPPPTCSFFLACLFFSLPPINVSSASTGPANGWPSLFHASRIRWPKCHADFWVIPKSRCSFMLDTLLSDVVIRYAQIAQTRYPRFDASIGVFVRTLKNLAQSLERHRYGIVLCFVPTWIFVLPQCGQCTPLGQRFSANHCSDVASSGNICVICNSEILFR